MQNIPSQRRGACFQCSRKKRKCDHKLPRCSQCVKHGQDCHTRTFKLSTPAAFSEKQAKPKKRRAASLGSGASHIQRPPPTEDEACRSLTGISTENILLEQSESLSRGGNQGDFLELPFDAPVAELSAHSAPFPVASDHGPTGDRDPVGHELPDLTGILDEDVIGRPGSPCQTFPDLEGFADLGDVEVIERQDAACQIIPSFIESLTPFQSATHGHQFAHSLPTISHRGAFIDGDLFCDAAADSSASSFAMPALGFGLGDHLHCPMPWPDDMLASPERRFLWQYFLSIAETDFLCLDWEDVGHLYDFQHPYSTSLPQMALSSEILRNAIFCFAVGQYQLREGRSDFATLKRLSSSEASQAMRSQHAQQKDEDSHLLSMIYASPLLHYFSTERRDNLHYLRLAANWVSKMLAKRLSRPGDALVSVSEVPLTEFRWAVISTLCSLTHTRRPLGDQVCSMIEMNEQEISRNYSEAFRGWVSHPIYTFSPRLVNPLLRIGSLLEKQLHQLDNPTHDPDPVTDQAEQIDDVEELLLYARDCDMKESVSTFGRADPAAVIALNESMYAASTILVYARLHCLPFTTPFVRMQVHKVVNEIAKISVASHVSYSTVFPLFIAGCEAADLQVREMIKDRLREPKGVAYDRGDLVGALEHIWEVRDFEPGLPWPQWVSRLQPQYRISCLM